MKRFLYPLLLQLILVVPGNAQKIDILRADGSIYTTIRRTNQVNITYQQTPFMRVNYSARVADITADSLFLTDKRLGLLGLAAEKITGLQRVRSGLNLATTIGSGVVLLVVGRRLLQPTGVAASSGGAYLSRLLLTSGALAGATVVNRLITPRNPRRRLDQGYTFRATGAFGQ